MTSVANRAPGVHPPYRTYTFADGIRRGTEQEVAVQVLPTGVVTVPKSAFRGISPLKLDLQPADGLIFGKLKYLKAQPRNFKFRPAPGSAAVAPIVRFHIHAEPDAPLAAISH